MRCEFSGRVRALLALPDEGRIAREKAVSMTQDAYRVIAQFTVTAPSWNRYSGQMSSVPPARSIRVGAFDSILTLTCSRSPASLLVPADSAHRANDTR